MSDLWLTLELRLLVLRYGRQAVVRALAGLGMQSVELLELELEALEERKKAQRKGAGRKPATASTADLVADSFRDRPELIPRVEVIIRQFENRTFLPQLRDVHRFLDRAGLTRGRVKSRKEATRPFITALAMLPSEELLELSRISQHGAESDFALLAREIMGSSMPARRSPRDSK